MRDLATPPPASRGRGRRPQRPWQRLDQWSTALAPKAWTPIDVRDGAKGPLVIESVKGPVVARTPQRQEGHREMAVVVRYRDRDQQEVVQVDFSLSNGAAATALADFARGTLDNLIAGGTTFADVSLSTIAACQNRFIADSPRVQQFIKRYAKERSVEPKIVEHW